MSKPDQVTLTCPRCGHQQLESRAAFSAVCRKCSDYWRVQELLKPAPKAQALVQEQKQVRCFDCAAELIVPAGAKSTMCKKCSCYIDLQDYSLTSAVSKNFKTKGSFVIQPTGYVFNSETVATDAVIKGRFIGKIIAERSLTLYSTAQIKGTFTADRLIVPVGNTFHWPAEIKVGSVEIEGELVADIHAQATIIIRASGRLFGHVKARSLVAEAGAVLVGDARFEAPPPT